MDLINALPDELLDRLFHFLEAKDLVRASLVCRRFRTIADSERHWKSLCSIAWNIVELPATGQSTWKQVYVAMHGRFGPYVQCYGRVNRCWQNIFSVTHSRAPVIYSSLLRDGTSEEILNNVQLSLGEHARLPLEYRCSYRLCNGQTSPQAIAELLEVLTLNPSGGFFPRYITVGGLNTRPSYCPSEPRKDHAKGLPMDSGEWSFAGLFGAYEEDDYGDYFCSWTDDYIGDPQPAQTWHSNPSIFRHCCLSFIWVVKRPVPVVSKHAGVALCIRDIESSPSRISCNQDADHGRLDGCMVSIGSTDESGVEFFIYGHSFIEYMEGFAEKAEVYPVINNRFLKYDFNSVGDTGPYQVAVRTAFFRERSVALPFEERKFNFFYRITMRMKANAPKSDSCQLETRHWIITDATGEVTHVEGPGVVGNYPVMRPGAQFTWISRTSYKTATGTMHGYFTMRRIGTGAEVRIECPLYAMVAPEFVKGQCMC